MRRLFVVAALVTLIFSACQPQPRNGVEAPSTTRALSLEITAPLDGRETAWGFVTVTGIVSSPEAQVNVSGINVDVGQDGSFESDYILLDEGKNKLTAVATLEGKTVSIEEPFKVGNSLLMFPGEPSPNLEDWIDCRCALLSEE